MHCCAEGRMEKQIIVRRGDSEEIKGDKIKTLVK